MAKFEEAFNITLKHEGGYGHDPVDVGGETYRGIARNYHSQWSGWGIIDQLRSHPDFPIILNSRQDLNELVENFYKINYWNVFWGDKIPDQLVANEMFDTGVNMGVKRAVNFLQRSLNLLNRNQKNYADIAEDGLFGPNTLNTLKIYLSKDEPFFLTKIMNILQGMHYINYMTKSPSQERFARGWLRRVNIDD